MQSSKSNENSVRQPQQKRSQDRVDQILEATKRIIAQKGTPGLTINGIAEEANITAGSMYQYFPNKNAIIFALGAQYLVKIREQIESEFAEFPNNRSEFRVILMNTFDSYAQMHIDDPVLRDIWMGSVTDKKMKDLDWEDTNQNVAMLFEISHQFYPEQMHKELETTLLLLLQFAISATSTVIDSPVQNQRQVLKTARNMLEISLHKMEEKADLLEKNLKRD